jgi:predicted  nucleic acid-binding Zn-ribbon protein
MPVRKGMLEKRLENVQERTEKREGMIEQRAGKIEDRIEQREQKIDDRMQKIEDKRDELKQKFDEKTQELRAQFQEQVAKKAIRGLAQVSNLVTRFETRIAKLKADGKDTTTAEAQLVVVKNALATAKAKFDALKALYPTDGTAMTADQKTAVEAARKDAEASVKTVQDELKKLLDVIKPLTPANLGTSSVTQ